MSLIDVNDTTLYYERRGDGPAVLFVSGATDDAGHWTDVADLLSSEYTVVTYDRRGNSRSPRPPEWTATTIDEQADDAEALIRELRKLAGEYVDTRAGKINFADYSAAWLERKRSTTKPTTAETFTSHYASISSHGSGRWSSGRSPANTSRTSPGRCNRRSRRRWPKRSCSRWRRRCARRSTTAGSSGTRPSGSRSERRPSGASTRCTSPGSRARCKPWPTPYRPRWRAAVLLMASTGLRLGECLGLTVDRVDFLRRTIRVDCQLGNVVGGAAFATPKTRSGVRTIPVPSHVTDMLAAHLTAYPAMDGLIFTTSTGRPVRRSTWADQYRAACEAVGVLGRTRSHDLRHVAASSLIASGLSVSAVQAVLGHTSPADTLEVYTHFWPSDEDKTREAIGLASAAWFAVGQ